MIDNTFFLHVMGWKTNFFVHWKIKFVLLHKQVHSVVDYHVDGRMHHRNSSIRNVKTINKDDWKSETHTNWLFLCVLHRFSTEEAKERPLSIYQIFYQSGFVQFLIIIMKKKKWKQGNWQCFHKNNKQDSWNMHVINHRVYFEFVAFLKCLQIVKWTQVFIVSSKGEI